MREAKSAIRTLVKLQQERRKREADNTSCNRADWTEYCALSLMTEALDPAAAQAPIAEPPPPPAPEPEPAPVVEPEPEPDLVAEAEQYAVIYPERAALIRRSGGVPADVTFGPPDDDLVQAILTTHTPTLTALDRDYASAHAA